jgi:hypothetical protein
VRFLLRLRADCVCLGIWRNKAVSKKVAGGIAGLRDSRDSEEETLFSGDNTFVCNVMNLASDYIKRPNLINIPFN